MALILSGLNFIKFQRRRNCKLSFVLQNITHRWNVQNKTRGHLSRKEIRSILIFLSFLRFASKEKANKTVQSPVFIFWFELVRLEIIYISKCPGGLVGLNWSNVVFMERVKNVSDKTRLLLLCFYGLCMCVRVSSLAQKDGISPARCFISKCDIYHIGASRFKSYHGNFYSTHLPFTLLTSGVINRTVLYISHMRSRTRADACHSSQLSWHVFSPVCFWLVGNISAQTLKNDSLFIL